MLTRVCTKMEILINEIIIFVLVLLLYLQISDKTSLESFDKFTALISRFTSSLTGNVSAKESAASASFLRLLSANLDPLYHP